MLHGTRGVKMRNKRQAHCGTRSVLHHQGEATKLLIDARADVTRRNRTGQSPLDLARESNWEECIQWVAATPVGGTILAAEQVEKERVERERSKAAIRTAWKRAQWLTAATMAGAKVGDTPRGFGNEAEVPSSRVARS